MVFDSIPDGPHFPKSAKFQMISLGSGNGTSEYNYSGERLFPFDLGVMGGNILPPPQKKVD
jgi:hypothetical protein